MVGEWRNATIAEVCEGVFDGPHATPKKSTAGPVFLGIWNIENGRIDLRTTEHLSEEDWARWTRRVIPREGDIVFSYETKLGCVGLIPKGLRCCLGRRMALARPKRSVIEPRFFLYYFLAPEFQNVIRKHTVHGSTVDRIPLLEFPHFPLRLPPLAEQRAIAHILGTLDDKIELNRRMNETLEGMARAIFKSWFVDFDPVRAKADGRQPTGMDPATAALFPYSFEDSPLGKIPKGWSYQSLSELVTLQRGKTYKSALKNLPGPVLLGLASIERNGGFRDDKLSTYGGDSPPNLILRPGDLFVSLKDVTQSADLLGAVACVPPHVDKGRLTQDTVKLCLRCEAISRHVVYLTLLTQDYRAYCRAHATGTTNLGLSRDDFLAYPIMRATHGIEQAFDRVLFSLEARMYMAIAEARSLTIIRDALLPKLLSGEIRVAEAEKCVEVMA